MRVGWLILIYVLICPQAPVRADEDELAKAQAQVKAARRLLRDRDASNKAILEALAEAARSHGREPAEGKPDPRHRKLDKSIETLLLKALAVKDVPRGRHVNRRHEVQFAAARHLGRTRIDVAPRFMDVLRRDVFGDADYVKTPSFYDVALRSLIRLDHPATFEFLLDRCVNADVNDDSQHLSMAAIEALRDMPLTGAQRRQCVRRLIDIFQSYAFHWQNKYDAVAGYRGGLSRMLKKVAGTNRPYWIDTRPIVLEAIRAWSIDPRSGLPPFEKRSTDEFDTLPRWLNWFQGVARAKSRPWLDARPGDPLDWDPAERGRHVRPIATTLYEQFGVPWEVWWRLHRPRTGPPVPDEPGGASVTPEGEAPLVPSRRRSTRRDHRAWAKSARAGLRKFLDHEQPEVRAAAVLAVVKSGGKDVVPKLLSMLEEDDAPCVREAAALGLVVRGTAAQKDLLRRRVVDGTENARIRGYAVLALGRLGDARWVWELLGTRRPDVQGSPAVVLDLQCCAIRAIGLAEDRSLAGALLACLRDGKMPLGMRGHVGQTLAQVGDATQVPELLRLMRLRRKKEEERVLGCSIATALGHLVEAGDRKAIRTLARRVLDPKGQFAGTRNELVIALGRIGGPHTEQVLLDSYEACLPDTGRWAERGWHLLAFALHGGDAARRRLRQAVRGLDNENDLAAGVTGLVMANEVAGGTDVRVRVAASDRVLTAPGVWALGYLGDHGAGDLMADFVETRRARAVVVEGILGLGLAGHPRRGALLFREAWWRFEQPSYLDGLAWAARWLRRSTVVDALSGCLADDEAAPLHRAYALVAAGRMADPDTDPFLTTFGRGFNPYAQSSPTLRGLALYGDSPFLR